MRIIESDVPTEPKVSVLVPVFNTSSFLPACLDSLLAQTLTDIEFICLNDGSTDDSLDILVQYQKHDKRIRVVDKPNAGYGATMNLGISLARAPYIGILESDDFAEPDMFETLYRFAVANDCDVVKCNYFEYASGTDVEHRPFDEFRYEEVFDPRNNFWVTCVLPIIWAALYKRAMIEDNGIRFNETPGASYQDTSFVFQCWAAARRIALLAQPLIHYRVDNASSSVKSSSKVFEVCGEYALSQSFLDKDPARQEAFGSIIHVLKLGTYKWNYERINTQSKEAFAQRMCKEYRAALQAETLSPALFNDADWDIVQDVLRGADYVLERYPNDLENAEPAGETDPETVAIRWLTTDETMKQMDIASKALWEGHYAKGCACVERLANDFAETASTIAGISLILERLDPMAIAHSKIVPGSVKLAYSSHLNPIERLRVCWGAVIAKLL